MEIPSDSESTGNINAKAERAKTKRELAAKKGKERGDGIATRAFWAKLHELRADKSRRELAGVA